MNVIIVCTLIGLVKATTEYAPHHVDLILRDGMQNEFPGSGVLVSLKHVLTVATNVDGFVEWEVTHGNELFGRETLFSKSAIIHPEFSFPAMEHNLAILVLPTSLKATPATLPVGLPEAYSEFPTVGDFGLVSSFHGLITRNSVNSLTYGPHQVVANSYCEEMYSKIAKPSNYFCATQNQYRICGGSQGTGFIENVFKKRTLAGILSFGEIWNESSNVDYLVYVRISPYVNWIRRNTMN